MKSPVWLKISVGYLIHLSQATLPPVLVRHQSESHAMREATCSALSPSSPLCLSPQPSPIKTPFYWPLTAPLTYWDPVAFIDPTCISEKRTFIEPFSNDSTRVCCFPPPPWLVQKPWGPWTCLGLDIWGEEPDFPLMVLIWTLREMWTLFFTRAGKAEHKSHLRLHIYSPLPAREHLENYDVHLWNSVDGRCSKNVPQA